MDIKVDTIIIIAIVTISGTLLLLFIVLVSVSPLLFCYFSSRKRGIYNLCQKAVPTLM